MSSNTATSTAAEQQSTNTESPDTPISFNNDLVDVYTDQIEDALSTDVDVEAVRTEDETNDDYIRAYVVDRLARTTLGQKLGNPESGLDIPVPVKIIIKD